MKNPEKQSLWSFLEDITKNLQHKRLADVFRIISFHPFETYDWHEHLRFEINFVKKGRCILHLENESVTFAENEMMIISSHVNHAFEVGAEGATLLQLEFLPEVFARFDTGNNSGELVTVTIFSKENRLIKIVNNVRIMRAVQRIVNEMGAEKKYYQYLVVMYYAELLILIYRHIDEVYLPICTNDALIKAIAYLRLNYQSEFSITDVAEYAGVGERYLRKLFSQYLNISPLDYLNQLRINKSMELLRNTEMSVKEVSFKCGFNSPQYFSRLFKRQTGLSPKNIIR